MKEIENILNNKDLIVYELREWAETFDWELDDDGERTTETCEYILGLASKLETNICDKNDYENILFHIGQINYNEVRVTL